MGPRQSHMAESLGERRIDIDLLIRDHAGQNRGDGDIENRAEGERGDNADGNVTGWIARLLSVSRDRIETDVGVKYDGRPGHHSEGLTGRSFGDHADDDEDTGGAIMGPGLDFSTIFSILTCGSGSWA